MKPCRYSESHACDESCTGERCRLWETIKPTETLKPAAAEISRITGFSGVKLKTYQQGIYDFMEGIDRAVPGGCEIKIVNGFRSWFAWYAKPKGGNRFTHRWNGSEWKPI